MRPLAAVAVTLALLAAPATAQTRDTTHRDKRFFTRQDALVAGVALGASALLSIYDDDIALASQRPRFQDSSKHRLATRISKVNETTLTAAGLLAYGIGRLTGSRTVADVALHATESVVLASLASQVIRGPLGRARPYVTADSNQYDFEFFAGFRRGEAGFRRRAYPSIHTSSSMAVATALAMELKRRDVAATPYLAPVLYAAGLLPGLARIQLDLHWASDVAAGAFMGVFAGYKVVSYSHDNPTNRFDKVLLRASLMPDGHGGVLIGFSPF